jgi:hypothetical protein
MIGIRAVKGQEISHRLSIPILLLFQSVSASIFFTGIFQQKANPEPV